MRKIIVPTDFSYASKDAFHFALSIAPKLEAEIEVVHIYSELFNAQNPYAANIGMGRYESLLDNLKNFASLERVGGVVVETAIKITYRAIDGLVSQELLKLSRDADTLMMVLGMTGKGLASERLFGTISLNISQNADCPVLLIPKNASFTGFKNMLYASDYDSVEADLMRKAIDFSIPFETTLHFIHVQEKKSDLNIELEDKLFNYLFGKGDPNYAINMASIDADSVTKGLNQYIEENNIDLTIMVTHHRTFWEGIIHRSITKEMAITAKEPILIFHADFG